MNNSEPEQQEKHNQSKEDAPLKGRLLWFITIWVLGVAALGAISYTLRLILSIPY